MTIDELMPNLSDCLLTVTATVLAGIVLLWLEHRTRFFRERMTGTHRVKDASDGATAEPTIDGEVEMKDVVMTGVRVGDIGGVIIKGDEERKAGGEAKRQRPNTNVGD